MLTVTTAATDPTLLSTSEVADAIGQTNVAEPKLFQLSKRVSELITDACNVTVAGAALRTMREETLEEKVRIRSACDLIVLSRKPLIEVLTVLEDDTAMTVDVDYEIQSDGGLLRISGGAASWWAIGPVTISYRAGWATVPEGLKELACKLALTIWSEKGRDPSLGSMEIPGVISTSYRYGKPDDPLIPSEIMDGLRNGRYVNTRDMIG